MPKSYTILFDDKEFQVEIEALEKGYAVKLDGAESHVFEPLLSKGPLHSFLIDGREVMEADLTFRQDKVELNLRNVPYHLEVFDPRRRAVSQSEAGGGHGLVSAPMPGKIVDVKVKVGDEVQKGQALVVIEAMKMQNELTASIDGVVKEVAVQAGVAVESGQKLVLVEKTAY